ncbi:MAG: hypothetical protein ACKO9I_20085 [Sphaerospermopsis kisseleviana]|uniref:hypothetical protein n=1 Tax=Sphaerospermopsis sp. LEGE 00249 TaxID=1380707 RepID=UPI00164D9BF6|nr:hypothetical protein [Sphaerospermopsis sp. LEGE 00249]MBC5796319.1 hypothetical protein [Sphaerospermopsis sp. LEGE 00249]MEB3150112.1 hypothetical protein [Sphaerospermopsis sp.]
MGKTFWFTVNQITKPQKIAKAFPENSDYLPVLTGIELNITVQEVFSWLSL